VGIGLGQTQRDSCKQRDFKQGEAMTPKDSYNIELIESGFLSLAFFFFCSHFAVLFSTVTLGLS
jgi:hypothetical protein